MEEHPSSYFYGFSSPYTILPLRFRGPIPNEASSTWILALTAVAPAFSQISSDSISARARSVHESAIVVDTHADTPQRFLDENYDMGNTDPADPGHISLKKVEAGNLGAEFFSIWVDPQTTTPADYARHTIDLIDTVYEQVARHPDHMMMAYSVADIERAHKEHKLAALMGIEGGHSMQNDVRLLREYYRLGIRYMTLTLVKYQRLGGFVGRHQ